MGWSQPIVRRHVRVVGNADSPLHWRMYGAETSAPEQRTANGRLEWRWHLRDLPVADDESGAPAWWDGYPWLQLSQFGSWSEVVAWGVPLYDRSRPGPRLRALAQEIRATDGDPVEQALIAVRRVQDEVRYFAFTLGEGSHAPRPAEETLRRRFGDCKDKTNLLVHLLRELGHEAWPALVSSDGDETARRLPSPGVFDHVIVLARVAGREVWIDPTIQLQGGDLWHLALPDYRSALVLRPGESDLVVPPAEARRPGAFEGETTYDLRSDGSCEVTVTSRHLGAAADDERANLSDTTPDELQDAYRDYYERGGGQVEPLAPIGFDDDRRTNVLTTVERYRLDDWWLDDGDGRRFPLLRLTIGDILDAAPERGRRAPFDIPRGVDHREVVHLSMPADWKVEADTREVSSPYFTFSSRLESGPPIRLEWRLETGDHEVPAADIGPYNDAVDAVDQLLDATVLDPSIVGLVMPRTAAVLSLATVGLGALGIVLGVGFVLRKARWL